MKKNVVILAVVVALLVVGVCFYFWQKQNNVSPSPNNDSLSPEIRTKLECGRLTLDFRYTDIFCNNPKFYNDPDSVTLDDYYKYSFCDEHLKNPPNDGQKTYNAETYYDCKEPERLKARLIQFIQKLKELKTTTTHS